MTEKEKMLRGLSFKAYDPELRELRSRCRRILQKLHTVQPSLVSVYDSLLAELFGQRVDVTLITPFHCDHGIFITMGKRCLINSGCTILDCAPVTMGDYCYLAPGVKLLTSTHPIHPDDRRKRLASAKPITLGDQVWLGTGVVVTPGVTIGHNSIIGGGSVVTKDIPPDVIAYGTPCKVVRHINENDKIWIEQHDGGQII